MINLEPRAPDPGLEQPACCRQEGGKDGGWAWLLCSEAAAPAVAAFLADVRWPQVGWLAAGMVIIHLGWETWAVYPLKLLVVFLHELSHAMAAWLTGGKVYRLEIDAAEGGKCVFGGGNAFLVLSAGYLGSLVWGGVILTVASRTGCQSETSLALGALMVAIGLFYVRPFLSFGQLFVLLSGAGLFYLGRSLAVQVNDLALRVIGLTCCMYATLDIKSDILDRPEVKSDAAMLADITGVPTLVWGLLWAGASVVCSAYFVLLASKKPLDFSSWRPGELRVLVGRKAAAGLPTLV